MQPLAAGEGAARQSAAACFISTPTTPPSPPPTHAPCRAQEADDWRQEVERLRATTEKDMWRGDLDTFETVRCWAAGLLGGMGGVGGACWPAVCCLLRTARPAGCAHALRPLTGLP